MKSIWAFIKAMPEVLELIRQIIKTYEEHRRAEKLKKDLREINEAFRDRDGDRLARVFNNARQKAVPTKDD